MTKPVVTSTTPPVGTPARRVIAAVGGTVEGGPVLPVYVVSQAQVDAGWRVEGNPPEVMVAVADGRAVVGQRPIPVFVVSGSFNPTPPTGLAGQPIGLLLALTHSS